MYDPSPTAQEVLYLVSTMPKISTDEVAHIAHLARIALSGSETKQMATELAAILGYVEKLNSVDTKNVKTTSQVTGLTDVWRKDEVKKSPLSRDELLANAPDVKDGFIRVKKVL